MSSADTGPLLGALLRAAYQEIAERLDVGFGTVGAPVIVPAVTQPLWDHPEGLRLTALAARARMTKQSMSELVARMEAAGYVEKVLDPADRRARLLRLTPAGRAATGLARDLVRSVESDWRARVGDERVRALAETLRAILSVEGR